LVSGPNGQFSTTRHPAAKYLFLSAGSGITPLMSMLRASADSGQNDDIVFVHSARAPRDVIFAAELAALEASQANIRVITICEQVPPGTHLAGQRGRLSLPMLQALVPDLTEREVFTCGPVPYMEVVRQILKSAAVDPTRCHEESFDLSHSWASGVSADRRSPGDEDVPAHCIELRFSARRISCPPGTTVLAAAAAAGLSLRSSCAEGVCGTCKTTLISGEVEMNHQGGIRSREIDQHKILLCCSTPTTDLVIDA
jgi:ferredoxin-NADP reductase